MVFLNIFFRNVILFGVDNIDTLIDLIKSYEISDQIGIMKLDSRFLNKATNIHSNPIEVYCITIDQLNVRSY